MKLILAFLLAFSFTFADDNVPDVGTNPFWTVYQPVKNSFKGSSDTVTVTTSDSVVIYNGSLPQGYDAVMLKFPIPTGTGTDSVNFAVRIDGLDKDGNIVNSFLADTITTAAVEISDLGFGDAGRVIGGQYKITAVATASNGGSVKYATDDFEIYAGRSNLYKTVVDR